MEPNRLFADTNLFLRYLTNDVPEQAEAVEQVLHRAAAGELALVTNALVTAELVWTLESFYQLSRSSIKEKVLAILNTPALEVVDGELVLQAVTWYTEKNIDFIDAYNGAWMQRLGLKTACTFDRKHFSRLEGVTVMVPTKTPQGGQP
ncbi:MAG: PIN domain-containing protein [Candidatus Entotheonellia bacterium]